MAWHIFIFVYFEDQLGILVLVELKVLFGLGGQCSSNRLSRWFVTRSLILFIVVRYMMCTIRD